MRFRLTLGLLLLGVVGGLLRAGYLITPIMDSDQAVHGLQSRHFLLGEFAAFQWGLGYMGTFQAFLTATAFALFGSSRLVLNVVPLFVSLPFILVTYQLGREMGGERVGFAAASLVTLAPPALAVYGAWARHGYIDSLLFGSTVLLLSLRLARRPLGEVKEVRLFAVLGLVSGLAWWTNFLSLYYLAPAALFLLLKDWRFLLRRGPWVALAFFALGSAPFWIFNLLNSFWSFALFKGGDVRQAPLQLLQVVTEGLPTILGLRESHSRMNFIPVVSEGVLVLYAVAFGLLVWRRLSALWTKQQIEPGLALLLLFFGNAALILSLSRFGEAITAEGSKRYLLPLYSAFPLLYAVFLGRARAVWRPLFVPLLVLPLALHLYGNLRAYRELVHELPGYRLGRAQEAELFRFLKGRGLTRVYVTDYWLGPRLTFDAGEEVIFALPVGERYVPYLHLVDMAPRVAHLFVEGTAGLFEASLKGIGAVFERTVIGRYEVLHDFRQPQGLEALGSLPPRGWRATASSTETAPALAFDRDVDTSWYSGEAQRPGLFFQADLGRRLPVGKVVLLSPRPSIGFPRGYRIEVSADGSRWEETAAVPETIWSLDWDRGQPRMGHPSRVVSAFEPREVRYLRVHQTGADESWWWAIGELFVYGPASAGSAESTREALGHVGRGRAYVAEGLMKEAITEYWTATRLDPALEVAHARLAALYDRAGIPLEGAASPEVRARAFEGVRLWAKAADEYEKEIRQTAYHRHHTELWRRLSRVYREAGEEARAREVEVRVADEFTPAMPAQADFEDGIRFLGHRLEPGSVTPGGTVHLTYYWQSLRRTRTDYAVFVHFVRDGKARFQRDHFPLDGAYPTSQWRTGERIREPFDVVVPDALEPGTYEIVVGLWNPRTGQRLGVKDTRLAHRKDRVVIGTLTVERKS